MGRTTSTAVEEIIEVDASISLDPFIEAANNLVTSVCTNTAYTVIDLELIERWLSAHFYTNRDMRAESEKAGSVGAKYQSSVDLGFDTSHYGQMAMRLAIHGELGSLNEQIKSGKGRAFGIGWLGTDPNA